MTSITTSNNSHTATQAREATERSVDVLKTGAKTFTDQLGSVKLPTVDLNESVTRYFEYLQKAVDFNRDLANQWAELVTTPSGSVREQAREVAATVQHQTDKVADFTINQAEKVELTKNEAEQADEAEQAKVREAKRVQRDEVRKAQQRAREAYKGLTKTELSDQLAERGLPKTGNIEDLIERLVSANSE